MTQLSNRFIGALLIGVSLTCQAQNYNDYKLGDYKVPDIKRSSLDLNINSQGNFRTRENNDKNSFQMNGELMSKFNRYTNTRRMIANQSLDLQLSGMSNGRSEDQYVKNQNVSVLADYSNLAQLYVDGKRFWLLGGDTHFSYNKSKSGGEKISDELGFSIAPTVGLGWGRIEPVEDARQAVYILDELSKKGVMTKLLSGDEVNSLAQVMSSIKNKRFLDSRLHLIDEVTKVDSFLLANNYIKNTGAKYFTTLYDNWLYAGLQKRGSGSQLAVKLQPLYNYKKHYISDTYQDETGLGAFVSWNYKKAVNLYWQSDLDLGMSASYFHRSYESDALYSSFNGLHSNQTYIEPLDVSSTDVIINVRSAEFNGRYTVGYYPNSRTNFDLSLNQRVNYNNSYGSYKYFSETNLLLSTYYYLSPQLRLSGNVGVANNSSNSDVNYIPSCRWSGRYSFSLTYSFF